MAEATAVPVGSWTIVEYVMGMVPHANCTLWSQLRYDLPVCPGDVHSGGKCMVRLHQCL